MPSRALIEHTQYFRLEGRFAGAAEEAVAPPCGDGVLSVECANGGEVTVKLGDQNTAPSLWMNHHMKAADARQALRTGQLTTSSFELAYGSTRPERLETVADGFRLAARETRKRGFPGLRVAARMDGLTDLLGSIEERHDELEVISPGSPLGACLIGAKAGDTVSFEAPNGNTLTVQILAVE